MGSIIGGQEIVTKVSRINTAIASDVIIYMQLKIIIQGITTVYRIDLHKFHKLCEERPFVVNFIKNQSRMIENYKSNQIKNFI